jgi:hypothetical protein
MLADFFRKQATDNLFLQEVTMPIPDTISGYTAYNFGTSGRGTAFLPRDHMELRGILRRLSFRVCINDVEVYYLWRY